MKFTLSLEWVESNNLLWATLIEGEKILYDNLFDQVKLKRLLDVKMEVKKVEVYKDKFGYQLEGTASFENIYNQMWEILEA